MGPSSCWYYRNGRKYSGVENSYLFSDTTTGVWGIQNNRVGLISSHDNINIPLPRVSRTWKNKQTNNGINDG